MLRTAVILVLFTGFLAGALVEIQVLLQRRPTGDRLERFRLLFFFAACLLLICLIPLWWARLLSSQVLILNLAGVGANLFGWALTFRRGSTARPDPAPEAQGGAGSRVFQLYLQGEPYGVITRETFGQLTRYGLLKKQQTVELVDDFQERAAQQGVEVQRYTNKEGTQTLIKVQVPAEKGKAD
ncbi:MAG: hypothetical protein WDA75_06510 [Candidatus Latescibacterota bacterium]|jgi:hypothetical protein